MELNCQPRASKVEPICDAATDASSVAAALASGAVKIPRAVSWAPGALPDREQLERRNNMIEMVKSESSKKTASLNAIPDAGATVQWRPRQKSPSRAIEQRTPMRRVRRKVATMESMRPEMRHMWSS